MKLIDEYSGLRKISGTIKNYKCTRASANFVISKSNIAGLGVLTVTADILGLSGQAASLASTINTEEDADYLEFEIDEFRIKGWVWRSPFSSGDDIELVAEWRDNHFELFGIIRPKDKIIALYPHCSRGSIGHWLNSLKWWFWGVSFVTVIGCALFSLIALGDADPIAGVTSLYSFLVFGVLMIFYPFFLIMTIFLSWKWMTFVKIAEKIFTALELQSPKFIDLRKSSRNAKRSLDNDDFGIFYFRY